MAANVNDLFKKSGASTVTTLAAPGKALGATSITVGSTTNYPTDTGITIAIRVVNTNGALVSGTYTEWRATVTSGTTLAIEAAPVYGSDQVYAAGSTTQVFIPLSSDAHNELIDGILVEHKQDGTHEAVTADSVDSATFVKTDTVSEHTSGAGVTIDGFAIKDGAPKKWDGWINPDETWTYASASTFTVAGDVTARYSPGTRLKFTQTTVKYGTVASSTYSAPNTTVTIIVNTDFVLANAAITAPFYSYAVNPSGYPAFFNYVAPLTNVSGGTVNVSRFSVVGNRVKLEYRYTLGGAGVTGSILVGSPVSINTTTQLVESTVGHGFMLDTGTQLYSAVPIVGSSVAIQLRPINASASYATFANNTSSTIPFTWGGGDQFGFSADLVMA